MRVLYLNPIGRVGGGERVMLDLVAATRQLQPTWELHVLALEDGPLLDEARRLGTSTHVSSTPASFSQLGDSSAAGRLFSHAVRALSAAPAVWQSARALRDHIARIQPDVIHSNGLKTHLLHALSGCGHIPTVWHIHDFVGSRPLIVKLLRRLSRDITPVAISQAVADDIKTWLRDKPAAARAKVVHNGIDLERFCPGEANGVMLDELAKLPPAPPRTVRIGIVATYARWKGQDVFLRAAAKVAQDRPVFPVRFYVIGGPIYSTRGSQFSREELTTLASDPAMVGTVGFIDFRQDTQTIYRSLDIVVHASSRPEPFGLTVAEAMACGRAVIVSAAGGAASLFRDGHDALGVAPNDVNALGGAITRLLDNPAMRSALAARAMESAVERFDRTRMAREFALIYQSITDPKSAGTTG